MACLRPFADVLERHVRPPYRAEAARQEGDLWAVGANAIAIATLSAAFGGDQIVQSSFGGELTCTVDGEQHDPVHELTEVGRSRGDNFSLVADRLDETTWVVRADVI